MPHWLTLSMLYVIPDFVYFHNYLLYEVIVILQRCEIPKLSPTHRDKVEDSLVLALLVNQSNLLM